MRRSSGGCVSASARIEGAQQLALARAGRADADAVRPHAELRRLLEVEQHRPVPVVEPDRHPQEVARRARRPQAAAGRARPDRRCRAGPGSPPAPTRERPPRTTRATAAAAPASGPVPRPRRRSPGPGCPATRTARLAAQVLDRDPVAVDGDPHRARRPAPAAGSASRCRTVTPMSARATAESGRGSSAASLPVLVADHEQTAAKGERRPVGESAAHLGRVARRAASGRAPMTRANCGMSGGDPAGGDRAVVRAGVEDVRQPLAHSHSAKRSPGTPSPSARSSGAWVTAACTRSARATRSTPSRSPTTLTSPTRSSGTVSGWPADVAKRACSGARLVQHERVRRGEHAARRVLSDHHVLHRHIADARPSPAGSPRPPAAAPTGGPGRAAGRTAPRAAG